MDNARRSPARCGASAASLTIPVKPDAPPQLKLFACAAINLGWIKQWSDICEVAGYMVRRSKLHSSGSGRALSTSSACGQPRRAWASPRDKFWKSRTRCASELMLTSTPLAFAIRQPLSLLHGLLSFLRSLDDRASSGLRHIKDAARRLQRASEKTAIVGDGGR